MPTLMRSNVASGGDSAANSRVGASTRALGLGVRGLIEGLIGLYALAFPHLFDATMQVWQSLINEAAADPAGPTAAERILAYDAEHRGEKGFYRITFAALSETDDEDVKAALRSMYSRFTGKTPVGSSSTSTIWWSCWFLGGPARDAAASLACPMGRRRCRCCGSATGPISIL